MITLVIHMFSQQTVTVTVTVKFFIPAIDIHDRTIISISILFYTFVCLAGGGGTSEAVFSPPPMVQ